MLWPSFYSYDDWFIGSTVIKKGIPKEIIKLTKTFKYNDLKGLNDLISKYKNNIACLVVEPAATTCQFTKLVKIVLDALMKYAKKNIDKNHFLKKFKCVKKTTLYFYLMKW